MNRWPPKVCAGGDNVAWCVGGWRVVKCVSSKTWRDSLNADERGHILAMKRTPAGTQTASSPRHQISFEEDRHTCDVQLA